MILVKRYKCPYCKHKIVITRADFIKGIAVVSCTYCGKEAYTIEENGFSRQPFKLLKKRIGSREMLDRGYEFPEIQDSAGKS